jgi:hypothetical protein
VQVAVRLAAEPKRSMKVIAPLSASSGFQNLTRTSTQATSSNVTPVLLSM